MSDAFDQAMAGLSGGSPTSGAPAAAAAPASQPSGGPVGYSPIIQQAAQKYNVDPRLLASIIQTESGGNPGAVSNKGATGLMQIDPSNYKSLGITNPKDPTQNIMGGAQLMSQLLDRYGDVNTALTHYVGGDDQKQWGPQTAAYPGKVLANFQRLSGGGQAGAQPSADAQPATPSQQKAAPDAFDAAMSGVNAPANPAQPSPGSANQPAPETSFISGLGHSLAGLTDTALSYPGQVAQQADYNIRRAFQQTPAQAQAATLSDLGDTSHLIGNALGVTNTAGYQGEATQKAQRAVGGVMNKGVGALANATGLPPQDVASMAGSLAMLAPGVAKLGAPVVRAAGNELGYAASAAAQGAKSVAGAVGGAASDAAKSVGQTASDFGNAVGTVTGLKAPEKPALTNLPMPEQGAPSPTRASIGAAGTSYAAQAAAEGVPEPIVQKIAAQEQAGAINTTAAERHIEAGSLPVPVELTEGQASGDVNMLSNEVNSRGKNPQLADRYNAQNGQLADNLTALRDQVSPNVNVPSGAPTGQALVDAYKQMDEPIRDQISEQYAKARNADGTSALVDATAPMADFQKQIGPTRFNALPSRVQQIFADAKNNSVTIPQQFGGGTSPMTANDLMDIDQTLSGAIAEAKSPAVQHDIGQLRDSILSAPIDPAAGPEAVAAFKEAQANARTRFQAMDADPAYKASVNDSVAQGEPSPLADQFVQKYIAGNSGKAATANVQNMLQNLSNDPVNRELVASALMDHIRSQSGIDLRTGSGNISQAGLNKTIQGLGDKARIILGPDAAQTLEKVGNVARYTQEQPRGSFINNSNTAVTLMGHAGNLAKTVVERGANAVVPGAHLGSWARESLAHRANAQAISRALEPGAGLSTIPLGGKKGGLPFLP